MPSCPEGTGLDYNREFRDEGVYAGPGSYHMYHRIDGKLVAVGILDICNTMMNSAYFIYDPDYKFLNLGIIGAITEMQYLRLIRTKYNAKMTFYHLGELNIKCPKVNYKINYQPGYVLCPYTKKWIPYDVAKPVIEEISLMTL